MRTITRQATEGTLKEKGVRARLVDKDFAPKWDPPTLGDVFNDKMEVYTNFSAIIYTVNVGSAAMQSLENITEIHECLNFTAGNDRDHGHNAHKIFSVKFSTDGRELVAGSSDGSIYVFDLGKKKAFHTCSGSQGPHCLPREHIVEFFESCGFKCPERKGGTADFLQEVVARYYKAHNFSWSLM